MGATSMDVRQAVTVAVGRERAWEVFTAGFGSWWPKTHHIGASEPQDVTLEPRPGGRCYEIGADGAECQWGEIVAWEPPARLVLAWMLDAEWRFEPDREKGSEVEVRFLAEDDERTRVELVHRHLERYGDRANEIRDSVSSDEGWPAIMRGYAAVAEAG